MLNKLQYHKKESKARLLSDEGGCALGILLFLRKREYMIKHRSLPLHRSVAMAAGGHAFIFFFLMWSELSLDLYRV